MNILPSFLTFGSSTDDLKTKVEKRLDSGNPEDRVKELKFFFREQMRVTTYLQQKQEQLVKKIAEEKFATTPGDFEDVEDAMENSDWMKEEVYDSTEYKSFREGSILNAVTVLKTKDIFDGELDEDKKELVHDLDLKRDDILDGIC